MVIEDEIVEAFVAAFDGYVAYDIGTALNCGEIEALADLLTAFGDPDLAELWIHAHAQGDDEGDSHYNPNWSPP